MGNESVHMNRQKAPTKLGLFGFLVLATPALLYYPLGWVEAFARPPSRWWYIAENGMWLAMFSPVSFCIMLLLWPQLPAGARVQRLAAAIIIAFTGFIALQVFGFVSMFI